MQLGSHAAEQIHDLFLDAIQGPEAQDAHVFEGSILAIGQTMLYDPGRKIRVERDKNQAAAIMAEATDA